MSDRKWRSLAPRTRLRKLSLLLHKAEQELRHGRFPDFSGHAFLFSPENLGAGLPDEVCRKISALIGVESGDDNPTHVLRAVNAARHAILRVLEAEPAEWDLLTDDGLELDRSQRRVFPVAVYLEDIRSPYNVGSLFRTAEAFGVSRMFLSRDTPAPTHRRAQRTARGCVDVMPWETADLPAIEARPGVFALETGGTPLPEFSFPRRGIVLLGSEELGLSPESLELADSRAGRVTIPMAGAKRSLNVAVAFGILMWSWYAGLMAETEPRRNAGG